LLELTRQDQAKDLSEKLELKRKELEAYKLEVDYLREKTTRMQAAMHSPHEHYQESLVESYTGTVSP
jgi:hypothetical protein